MMRVLPVFVSVVALLSAGCQCSGHSDHLTVSITSAGGGFHAQTTPKWGDRYTHAVDMTFRAGASWAPEDDAPQMDLFEFYLETDHEPESIELSVEDCADEPSAGETACAQYEPGSECPGLERSWEPVESLEEGETYLLVMYPDRGNGKQLSWDGERVDFAGEDALVMDLEIGPPMLD